ncbi:Phage lysozyme, partial [Vibrio vulnificus BAA87]
MRLSNKGAIFLKQIEQLRLMPYDDQSGRPIKYWVEGATIGYGHLISKSEWDSYKDGTNEKKANELFKADLKPFESSVIPNQLED